MAHPADALSSNSSSSQFGSVFDPALPLSGPVDAGEEALICDIRRIAQVSKDVPLIRLRSVSQTLPLVYTTMHRWSHAWPSPRCVLRRLHSWKESRHRGLLKKRDEAGEESASIQSTKTGQWNKAGGTADFFLDCCSTLCASTLVSCLLCNIKYR